MAGRGQVVLQKSSDQVGVDPPTRTAKLERLVDVHYAPVLRLLTRLSGSVSAGEELTQLTFTGLVQSWRELGGESAERAYVMRSAYNAWRRSQKTRQSQTVDCKALERLPAQDPGALDFVCSREDLERVYASLLDMPDNHRAALVLIVLEGLSYREAAELMAVPRDTVAKWRLRAVARLREALSNGHRAHAEAG